MIRRVQEKDLDSIVKLNNLEFNWVGEKDRSFFEKYFSIPFFYVVDFKKKPVGFAMVMDQRTDYDSPNFLWFKERHEKLFYVDRIIIEPDFRGEGLGTKVYKKLMKEIKNVPLVAKVSDSNWQSKEFHSKFGFTEIGLNAYDGNVNVMYQLL